MDRIKMKITIRDFATDLSFAVAMGIISIFYGAIIFSGSGKLWILLLDIAVFIPHVVRAIRNWRSIKEQLGESK